MTLFAPSIPLAAILLAAEAQGPGAPQRSPQEQGQVAVRIAQLLEAEEVPSPADLVTLGEAALPLLFEDLAGGAFQDAGEDGETRTAVLDAPHRAVVRAALVSWPGGALLELLEARSLRPFDARTALAALDLLGEVGGPPELALAVRFATPPDRRTAQHRAGREAFSAAVQRMVARDPRTLWWSVDLLPRIPGTLVEPLLRASEGRPSEGLSVLARMLRQRPGADVLVLGELARLASSVPPPVSEEVCEAVRARLQEGDPALLLRAIATVAALDDVDAVPALVSLASDPRSAIAGAACAALRSIARCDPACGVPDAAAWRAWLRQESAWWTDEGGRVRADLASPAAAEVSAALLDVAAHPLHRYELDAPVLACLERSETGLVALACAVLGRLASDRAGPALERLADSPAPLVRRAAGQALRRIQSAGRPAPFPDHPRPVGP